MAFQLSHHFFLRGIIAPKFEYTRPDSDGCNPLDTLEESETTLDSSAEFLIAAPYGHGTECRGQKQQDDCFFHDFFLFPFCFSFPILNSFSYLLSPSRFLIWKTKRMARRMQPLLPPSSDCGFPGQPMGMSGAGVQIHAGSMTRLILHSRPWSAYHGRIVPAQA